MSDLRAPCLPLAQGSRLTRPVYKQDFRQRYAQISQRDSWKLERLQHFEEEGSASRDALRAGEWKEALRLLEEDREGLLAAAREDELMGTVFHRVRVVEKPFTPYLQWELHSLRQQAECGTRVRVVRAGAVAGSEGAGPLPEVVVLGGHTLYRVLYTESGACSGAIRYTDPDVVGSWEYYISELFRAGEDMEQYFEREVAPLPPPSLTTK
ncbi:DUF6879 family protein [Streptomyces sp. CAU 1734]|uniref:DUF6879 family protein n=1 Tax=Streptomyces sp. CAU 1734 TaxID=3140360 RepID=UPI0032604EA2